jgi:hypothetical protein
VPWYSHDTLEAYHLDEVVTEVEMDEKERVVDALAMEVDEFPWPETPQMNLNHCRLQMNAG